MIEIKKIFGLQFFIMEYKNVESLEFNVNCQKTNFGNYNVIKNSTQKSVIVSYLRLGRMTDFSKFSRLVKGLNTNKFFQTNSTIR